MSKGRAAAEALRIGEVVGEVAITVSHAMIDANAVAVGDANPFFMEKDASGRRIDHPELLPKFAMERLWLPVFERMPNIRSEQAYTYLEPVRTGEATKRWGLWRMSMKSVAGGSSSSEAIFEDENGKEVLRDRRTQCVLIDEVTIRS